MTNLHSILKSRDNTFLTKVPIVKAMVFPVVMSWCESWSIKKADFEELILSSCAAGKEIKPVNLKGNQPWIVIGRTDTEAPMLWPPDMKSWLIRKDPNSGRDWRQKEKRATEDEMLDSITDSMDRSLSKLREIVKGREAWHAAALGVAKSWTRLGDWTTTNNFS